MENIKKGPINKAETILFTKLPDISNLGLTKNHL